jgi:hypothetical protein
MDRVSRRAAFAGTEGIKRMSRIVSIHIRSAGTSSDETPTGVALRSVFATQGIL